MTDYPSTTSITLGELLRAIKIFLAAQKKFANNGEPRNYILYEEAERQLARHIARSQQLLKHRAARGEGKDVNVKA